MKNLILIILSLFTLSAAANERGGGAGVGGGGQDEMEFFHEMYPALSECDIVHVMLERYGAAMLPEDTLASAEQCGLLD